MDKIFFQPMKNESSISSDLIKLLFPNLDDTIKVHS